MNEKNKFVALVSIVLIFGTMGFSLVAIWMLALRALEGV